MEQRTIPLQKLFDLEEFRRRLLEASDFTKNNSMETGFVVWYSDEDIIERSYTLSNGYKGFLHVPRLYSGDDRSVDLPTKQTSIKYDSLKQRRLSLEYISPEEKLLSEHDSLVDHICDQVVNLHFHVSSSTHLLPASGSDALVLNRVRRANSEINPYMLVAELMDNYSITITAYQERRKRPLKPEVIKEEYPNNSAFMLKAIFGSDRERFWRPGDFWYITSLSTNPQLLLK